MIGMPFCNPVPLLGYWAGLANRMSLFAKALHDRAEDQIAFESGRGVTVICFSRQQTATGKRSSYELWRITDGKVIDGKAPVIIVDPRAGRGPGICGTKKESPVGIAIAAGHPVYIITFDMMPAENQTIEGVMQDIRDFVQLVKSLHPNCPVPRLVGNCQAGWMLLIARARYFAELCCPLQINGSPLSYWSGSETMLARGLLAQLASHSFGLDAIQDLASGLFDGAGLSGNFEELALARVVVRKLIDLWSDPSPEKVKTFLENETWWNQFYHFRPGEIRWIINNLFGGNRLEQGTLEVDGQLIDLSINAGPLIIFASHGDDITPPPQALGWIPKVFETNSPTFPIVFCLHKECGHLGIFVSANVARGYHAPLLEQVLDQPENLQPGIHRCIIQNSHPTLTPVTANMVAEICGPSPYQGGMRWIAERQRRQPSSPTSPPNPILVEQAHLVTRWLHPMRVSRWVCLNPGVEWITPWTSFWNGVLSEHDNRVPLQAEAAFLSIFQASANCLQEVRNATWALLATLFSQCVTSSDDE